MQQGLPNNSNIIRCHQEMIAAPPIRLERSCGTIFVCLNILCMPNRIYARHFVRFSDGLLHSPYRGVFVSPGINAIEYPTWNQLSYVVNYHCWLRPSIFSKMCIHFGIFVNVFGISDERWTLSDSLVIKFHLCWIEVKCKMLVYNENNVRNCYWISIVSRI